MRQPNAITYMLSGGFRYCGVLGGFYGLILAYVIIQGMQPGEFFDIWGHRDALLLSWIGFLIGAAMGGTIGLGVGFLSGFALDWFVRRLQFPLNSEDLRQIRIQAAIIVVLLCGVGAAMAFYALFGRDSDLFLVLLPAFISVLAMGRVANNYIKRLAEVDKPKRQQSAETSL